MLKINDIFKKYPAGAVSVLVFPCRSSRVP
jgi:hypothetical protein